MAMSASEWDRVIRIETQQAVGLKEVETLKGSMTEIKKCIQNMGESLIKITSDVSSIRAQNEGHEEKLAMLQELTASLGESVVGLDKCCKRLKHMLFCFVGILIVLAFLVGLLGEEVAPKALKWIWALVGL